MINVVNPTNSKTSLGILIFLITPNQIHHASKFWRNNWGWSILESTGHLSHERSPWIILRDDAWMCWYDWDWGNRMSMDVYVLNHCHSILEARDIAELNVWMKMSIYIYIHVYIYVYIYISIFIYIYFILTAAVADMSAQPHFLDLSAFNSWTSVGLRSIQGFLLPLAPLQLPLGLRTAAHFIEEGKHAWQHWR